MLKRVATAVVITVMSLMCFTGCSSTLFSKEFSTNKTWSIEYKKFSGDKTRTINTKAGETTVKVSIQTDEGTLALSVTDKDGKSYYSGTDLPTGDFSFALDGEKKYTIQVTGDEHSGKFSLDWSGE